MARRDHWYVDLRSGETKPYAVKAGQRVWVTHAKLVDPASAAAGQTVRVALRTRAGDGQSLVLSAERPGARVRSAEILEDEFWLERDQDDSADAVVRFRGRCVILLASRPEDEDGEVESDVEDGDDGEMVGIEDGEEMVEEYEATDEEMSDGGDGISDEEEEENGENHEAVLEEEEGNGDFVVSIGSMAGFMRVVTAEDAESQGGGDNDRQILELYRYTLFSAASFDGGVEACGSTMEHQLRFIADGGHGSRSLAWAGASLVPLIYPGHSSNQLRELWSSLIAGVSIPPHATRVEMFVEVGILWPADHTPARMGNMRAILKDMMAEPCPGRFTGMEMALHLPEPVRCGQDEDDDNDMDGEERPPKRRRLVPAGENCTVCLELLVGGDLAAWPGCGEPHVFHGRCMELVLQTSKTCPICRRKLAIH